MHAPRIFTTASLVVPAGDWVEIFNENGTSSFFMHTITDEQKDTLTEEERKHLLPAVDPYNNKLIMPLKVSQRRLVKVARLLTSGNVM